LRESEGRFRMVLESSMDNLYRRNLKTDTYDYMSPAVERILGYSVEEILSMPLEIVVSMMHPDDIERVKHAIGEVLTSDRAAYLLEYRFRHKDGQYRWLGDLLTVIRDTQGRPLYLVGSVRDITERKLAEKLLEEQTHLLRTLINGIPDIVALQKPDHTIIFYNKAGYEFLKKPPAEVDGEKCFKLIGRDIPCEICATSKAKVSKKPETIEKYLPDYKIWLEARAIPVLDEQDNVQMIVEILRNITERKRAEERIIRLTRLYTVLSKINEAIVRIHEPIKLYEQVCKIAVEDGQFFMVWIGIVDQETSFVKPIAHYGHEEGYLDNIRISVNPDIPEGRGPTGTAIREGKYFVCNDIKNDPHMLPWREESLKRGYYSSASFPLKKGTHVFGAINFYLGEPLFFKKEEEEEEEEEEEVILLSALADDLSFAIEAMDHEKKRKQAEKELHIAQERLQHLILYSPAVIYSSKTSGDYGATFITENIRQMTGYESREFIENPGFWISRVHPEDRQRILDELPHLFEQGSYMYKYRFLHKDGTYRWMHDEMKLVRDNDGNPLEIVGYWIDINERIRAEESVARENLLNEAIVNNIPAGIAFLDNDFILRKCNYVYSDLIRTYTPYTPEKAIGMSYFDYATGSQPQVEGWFQKVRDTGIVETRYGFKLILMKDEKELITYWDTSIAPVETPDGKVEGIMILTQDVTDRKKTEEKLKEQAETLQEQADQLRSLASQMSLIEEKERRYIATELHDSIGQKLALSKMKLEELQSLATSTNLLDPIKELNELIKKVISQTRSLTFEISPPILYELGFEAAVRWLGENYLKQYGIRFEFMSDGQPKPLSDDTRVLLFQSVRELMVNIVKHANAHEVTASIQRERDNMHLTIEDDGAGFDISSLSYKTTETAAFGLFSIRERMRLIGGNFEIASKPGKGTKATIWAPLKLGG
ncbi:MAG: PAS domain S-box protein, partial [Nitrospira sp.]|nr:PAS domain S-box protein [Nitrospira sp.]